MIDRTGRLQSLASCILDDTKAGFKAAEATYTGQRLVMRRDLCLLNPVDRFLCAAAFQHKPNRRCLSGYHLEELSKPESNKREPSVEICPCTTHYYADVKAAEDFLNGRDFDQAAKHIDKATDLLNIIRESLARMMEEPTNQPDEQDKGRILWAWNDVCWCVQKGVSLQDAVDRALRIDHGGRYHDDKYRDNGARQYFHWQPVDFVPASPLVHPVHLPNVIDMPIPRHTPTIEEWEAMFVDYKTKWSPLAPRDSGFRQPLKIMEDIDIEPTYPQGQPDDVTIMLFFLRAFGFETIFVRDPYPWDTRKMKLKGNEQVKPWFARFEKPEALKALEKFLSKVEVRRWHPDQLNKRSGVPGQPDETIGQQEENEKVFWAVKDLIDMLRTPKESFKDARYLNTNWERDIRGMRWWQEEAERPAREKACLEMQMKALEEVRKAEAEGRTLNPKKMKASRSGVQPTELA